METSTEGTSSPAVNSEPAEIPVECLEVTPCIEPADFLDGMASALLAGMFYFSTFEIVQC